MGLIIRLDDHDQATFSPHHHHPALPRRGGGSQRVPEGARSVRGAKLAKSGYPPDTVPPCIRQPNLEAFTAPGRVIWACRRSGTDLLPVRMTAVAGFLLVRRAAAGSWVGTHSSAAASCSSRRSSRIAKSVGQTAAASCNSRRSFHSARSARSAGTASPRSRSDHSRSAGTTASRAAGRFLRHTGRRQAGHRPGDRRRR